MFLTKCISILFRAIAYLISQLYDVRSPVSALFISVSTDIILFNGFILFNYGKMPQFIYPVHCIISSFFIITYNVLICVFLNSTKTILCPPFPVAVLGAGKKDT